MVVKKKEAKSRAIPLRLNAINDAYVAKLQEQRQYSSMNFTINRIIENHRTAFEVYRLKAKAKAKKLREDAWKLMQDFDLTDKDME